MNPLDDLAARLRRYRPRDEFGDPVKHTICDEAAAEIERLRTPPNADHSRGPFELRKRIMFAIFDPGASEGFKGDRDLTTWQTDAVMKVIQEDAGLTPEQAWQELCETPDITSPEEYPDHALITIEQLADYMRRAAASEGSTE